MKNEETKFSEKNLKSILRGNSNYCNPRSLIIHPIYGLFNGVRKLILALLSEGAISLHDNDMLLINRAQLPYNLLIYLLIVSINFGKFKTCCFNGNCYYLWWWSQDYAIKNHFKIIIHQELYTIEWFLSYIVQINSHPYFQY